MFKSHTRQVRGLESDYEIITFFFDYSCEVDGISSRYTNRHNMIISLKLSEEPGESFWFDSSKIYCDYCWLARGAVACNLIRHEDYGDDEYLSYREWMRRRESSSTVSSVQ